MAGLPADAGCKAGNSVLSTVSLMAGAATGERRMGPISAGALRKAGRPIPVQPADNVTEPFLRFWWSSICMEEIDPESLGEVAYGIFEVYLNRELRLRGPYLFEFIERGVDFEGDTVSIFERFQEDYPDLAGALLSRFGNIGAVYASLWAGEGILPSKTTLMYWIVQDAPGPLARGLDDERVGKWLIFIPPGKADGVWREIRDETLKGLLGISAKISTSRPNPDSRDERTVIYIYTYDWADEADVMRVRERLRDLGFTERIGYKRNIETYRGEYSEEGRKVTYYSA